MPPSITFILATLILSQGTWARTETATGIMPLRFDLARVGCTDIRREACLIPMQSNSHRLEDRFAQSDLTQPSSPSPTLTVVAHDGMVEDAFKLTENIGISLLSGTASAYIVDTGSEHFLAVGPALQYSSMTVRVGPANGSLYMFADEWEVGAETGLRQGSTMYRVAIFPLQESPSYRVSASQNLSTDGSTVEIYAERVPGSHAWLSLNEAGQPNTSGGIKLTIPIRNR